MTDFHSRLSFEKFFAVSEQHRWQLETDLDWDGIDRALVDDEELWTLRRAALVESFSPRYGADLLSAFADDAEMSAFITIQLYEEYKHFHALRRYLARCGVPITDDEVTARRTEAVDYGDRLVAMLKFGVSEIFTAVFYGKVAAQTREPVLKKLATFIANDEKRHLGWYSSALEAHIRRHRVPTETVIAAVSAYQHQGLDAIGDDWVELWNRAGSRYTGFEPYLYLKRLLTHITGASVDLKQLARRTSDTRVATVYR